jgi:hypothetical protein
MRLVLRFALVGALLLESPCFAGQKIKIEVVEATQNVLVTGGPKLASPEKKETHCKTGEADDMKTQDCTTITTLAIPASNSPPQMAIAYSAKIILPDGTHARIACAERTDGCGSIESATPEGTKQTWVGASRTTTGLGMFEAKRNKNEIVIYTPNGKRKYQVMGSW